MKICKTDDPTTFLFFCPGCECAHQFTTKIWTFNNDLEKPTIRASILVNGSKLERRCHSFVTDGQIQFLGDCFHKLKGTTVALPDFDSSFC